MKQQGRRKFLSQRDENLFNWCQRATYLEHDWFLAVPSQRAVGVSKWKLSPPPAGAFSTEMNSWVPDDMWWVSIMSAQRAFRYHLCNLVWVPKSTDRKWTAMILLKYKKNRSLFPSGAKVYVEKTSGGVSSVTDPWASSPPPLCPLSHTHKHLHKHS